MEEGQLDARKQDDLIVLNISDRSVWNFLQANAICVAGVQDVEAEP